MAEIFDRPLIQIVQVPLVSPAPHECRDRLDEEPKLSLSLDERFFGALPIVDVGEQNVPPGDVLAPIPKRKAANLNPTIDAVETPDARLEIVGLARRDRLREHLGDVRQIVGMHRPVRPPPLHRLEWLAAVFDQLLVDEVYFTLWRQHRDQAWNGLHDQARLVRAVPEGFRCPLMPRDFLSQSLVGHE